MADPESADLGRFFAASRAAIIELDGRGCVRSWNPAAERLLGWRSDEALARALPFVQSEDTLRFELFRRAVLNGDSHATFETILSKSGEPIPVRVWQTPAVDEAGRVAGVWMMVARANEREQALGQLRAI